MERAAASARGGEGDEPGYHCALTGDRLFGAIHPHELVEGGLAFCVRGSFDEGIDELALSGGPVLTADGELPLSAVDIVRWARLRPLQLDRSGFVKRWQRHVAALCAHLEAELPGEQGIAASDELLLSSHTFGRRLLLRFEELDFLTGASEDARGPLGILHYKDDEGLTPHVYFLAAGARRSPGSAGGADAPAPG